MDMMEQGRQAIRKVEPKSLRHAEVGEVIRAKADNNRWVTFTVTGIRKGQRGYTVSLRMPEGYEWGIPGVRWTKS